MAGRETESVMSVGLLFPRLPRLVDKFDAAGSVI